MYAMIVAAKSLEYVQRLVSTRPLGGITVQRYGYAEGKPHYHIAPLTDNQVALLKRRFVFYDVEVLSVEDSN